MTTQESHFENCLYLSATAKCSWSYTVTSQSSGSQLQSWNSFIQLNCSVFHLKILLWSSLEVPRPPCSLTFQPLPAPSENEDRILELTLYTQKSTCLWFSSAEIKVVRHHCLAIEIFLVIINTHSSKRFIFIFFKIALAVFQRFWW